MADCLPHSLLIAKLNAYGFDNNVMRFVYDYLTLRKQRTKVSGTYSSWQEILSGVPQGSIITQQWLMQLVFHCRGLWYCKLCRWKLFFIIEDCDIANYADENTPYFSGKKYWGRFERFREWFERFTENELKGNASKCHLLTSASENVHVNIGTS